MDEQFFHWILEIFFVFHFFNYYLLKARNNRMVEFSTSLLNFHTHSKVEILKCHTKYLKDACEYKKMITNEN